MQPLPKGLVEAYLSIAGEEADGGGSTESGAAVPELFRRQWREAALVLELVDAGQLKGELDEEDDGENECGENEKITAPHYL